MAQTDDTPSKRLEIAMKKKGRKAAELARALKVSEPTVSNWFSGVHGISVKNIQAAAAFLGISSSWLMFGTDAESEARAQDAAELRWLRVYRDMDDDARLSAERYVFYGRNFREEEM